MSNSSTASRARITIAFACVYLCWGSTYAAIRVAGMYMAPPLVAGCRSLLSALIICGICVARGKSLRVPMATAWRLVVVGVLFMTINNVLLTWSETMIPSGLASLVVATIPIMIAMLETMLPGGEALNKRGWLGVLLGTAGMVALLWPSLHHPVAKGIHMFAFGLLIIAGLAFAVGSVLSRRFRFKEDMFVATAWQITSAGIVNISIAGMAEAFIPRTGRGTG
jgi:drug/metabolite transporter (DMT)-like permease